MNSNSRGVAVVTVHGVADQQPGQTVRELARLLCHGGDDVPRYGEGETHGVLIPVAPLAPRAVHEPAPAAAPGKEAKAARLPRPGAPSDFYCSEAPAAPTPRASPEPPDLGTTLTDYLLSRYQPAESDALYESTRISLTRRADGLRVDLYELYWADYSRLKPGGVRALSATYQLLFHLSTLARDVIDQVVLAGGERRSGIAWRLVQRLHAWSAWLLRAPAALLQLALLLLFVFGLAALVPEEQQQLLLAAAGGAAAALLGGAALLSWLEPPGHARRGMALVFAGAAVGCLGIAVAAFTLGSGFPWLYFGVSALGTGALGLLVVWRFGTVARDVKLVGVLAIAATVALLFGWGAADLPHSGTQFEWMATAALHSGEYLLAALVLAWGVLVCMQIIALLLGFALAHGSPADVRESIVTARLGMILSGALFALLSLLLWSVLSYIAGAALDDLSFLPALLGEGYRSASLFIEAQVKQVGTLFTPLVLAASLLGACGLLALAPALREELVPTANLEHGKLAPGMAQWCARLGRWLGCARDKLQGLLAVAVPLLAIGGGVLYLAFVAQALFDDPRAMQWLHALQGESLVAAGKWLAGGAVTITALGTRFTQTIGKLRVALDAILDVDNYFRDPLDRRPPRARIFARYAALLAHLRERGYERIVIVSHSQGTVISADLLRYLHGDRRLEVLLGGVPVALVTLGSPLRDLYAERFPLLYAWLGSGAADFAAAPPGIGSLGVTQWVNAYRSGDYVGRAIWTLGSDPQAFAIAVADAAGTVPARRDAGRVEFCLGAGAHTHYFSNDAVALALELDRLIGPVAARSDPRRPPDPASRS